MQVLAVVGHDERVVEQPHELVRELVADRLELPDSLGDRKARGEAGEQLHQQVPDGDEVLSRLCEQLDQVVVPRYEAHPRRSLRGSGGSAP